MRSVVVTGANSGIGRAAVIALARSGLDVIGTVRTEEKAGEFTASLRDADVSARTVLLDVADPKSCEAAFAEIDELTAGGPWAVVNNAGVQLMGAVEDVTDDEARHILEVNLLGAARVCRWALPAMRRRGAGRIVNVTSLAGLMAAPFNGWYAASKHGLEALSDSLRMENARFGVRVSLVEPGYYETRMIPLGAGRLMRLATEGDSSHQNAYVVALGGLARRRPFPPAEEAADAIRRAVGERRPAARYRVGRETLFVRAARCVPSALTDGLLRRAAGLYGPVPPGLGG
ncbi:SDR family oxidoreductase [Streptomyces sp. NPDC021100]|uniref:SDR family oxidoreductase n=1 Tax=Streptomyces sp. NPDC021100 TaxID=3365114 RepID=UPI0037943262